MGAATPDATAQHDERLDKVWRLINDAHCVPLVTTRHDTSIPGRGMRPTRLSMVIRWAMVPPSSVGRLRRRSAETTSSMWRRLDTVAASATTALMLLHDLDYAAWAVKVDGTTAYRVVALARQMRSQAPQQFSDGRTMTTPNLVLPSSVPILCSPKRPQTSGASIPGSALTRPAYTCLSVSRASDEAMLRSTWH